MVVERVSKGGGFGRALSCVVVACCLNYLAEFAVGYHEARVGFLDVHGAEFYSEV